MRRWLLIAGVSVGVSLAQTRAVPSGSATDEITAVMRRLIASGVSESRGEFETTEQFNARRSAAMGSRRDFVFVLDADQSEFRYIADSGFMSVEIVREALDSFPGEDDMPAVPRFRVRTISHRLGSYIGKNSFGVAKTVTVSKTEELGVLMRSTSGLFLDNGNGGKVNLEDSPAEFAFPMRMDLARTAKPFMRVALVGSISDPRVFRNSSSSSATIDYPFDTKTARSYLNLNLAEIRVIDSRTGAMVARFVHIPQSR